MNVFAASLLLSQTTLENLLEMPPDARLLEYGDLVGRDRIVSVSLAPSFRVQVHRLTPSTKTRFNAEMARRLELMQLPPSSPDNLDTSSSLNSVPYIEDSEIEGLYA